MTRPKPVRVSRPRLSMTHRALAAAATATSLSLALLVAHVFLPLNELQSVALWLLGAALCAVWIAVLGWRVPVYSTRRLASLALLWVCGLGAAIVLVIIASRAHEALAWRLSAQWLALTLSLAVSGLFLRALLRVRSSSLVGRLASLAAPLCILAVILLLGRHVT